MKESNNNNGLYRGKGGLGLWSFGHGGLLKKKKTDTKEGGRQLFGEEKSEMGLDLWSFGHGGF